MAWSDMALDGGLSALRQGVSFIGAQQTADAKKAAQKYKNGMIALSGANQQNAITTNENMASDRSNDLAFEIDKSDYVTSAKAEVQAAAAGTGGRTVNMTMFDIDRNAANAQTQRLRDLNDQYVVDDAQRRNTAFQVATATDNNFIPEPSGAALALGLGTTAIDTYRKNTGPITKG